MRQANLTETFTYDALDRLDTALGTPTTMDVDYNSIGNITKKTDVSASTWTYDSVKKHAVRTAGSNTFNYDPEDANDADNNDDGNMRTRHGQNVTWFSHNYPNTINGSGGTSSTFTYDPLRQRVKQTAVYASGTETTRYIGGLLEKVCMAATCNGTNVGLGHQPNSTCSIMSYCPNGTLLYEDALRIIERYDPRR